MEMEHPGVKYKNMFSRSISCCKTEQLLKFKYPTLQAICIKDYAVHRCVYGVIAQNFESFDPQV